MPDACVEMDADLLVQVVPPCLRERAQWVCWRYVERGGKETKCPISPTKGGPASSTDPATWGTFEQAVSAWQSCSDLAGVGFVFSADDPFAGVDLDKCIDASGNVKPWALPIIQQLDSYAEISPSSTGIKVFVRSRKKGGRCSRGYEDGKIEMYDSARFFTVTGERLPKAPTDVNERQAQFDAVYDLVFPATKTTTPPTPTADYSGNGHLDDEAILRLATKSRRGGKKFTALWAARWSEYFNSQSEADSSVVFTLAFYTKDSSQIDRLFRRSALMREKWNEQHGAQTYGEMTIARALEKVTSQYVPRNTPLKRRAGANPSCKSALPDIVTTDQQLRDLTDVAIDAMNKFNDPPVVYVRSGSLVRVIEDEKHIPKIERLDRAHVRCRLSETANFYISKRSGDTVCQISVLPPLPLAENILVQSHWPFSPLAGLARAPIVRPDGSICVIPGYDAQTKLLYVPDPDLKLTEIPECPNIHEVHACVDILMAVIDDFPFADQASKANALSVLFSVLLRAVIRGHIPLAIFDAPVQGTGKTLLVMVLVFIAVGMIASESVPSKVNEDEWRKKITSILMNSAPVILLDNIPDNTAIDSPMLASALTAHEWSDRVLGRSETIRVPSKAVWVATGNNLRVAGDMPRRSYTIRLDAQAERPWERSGFRIADLEEYVRRNRGELLSAALTIVRAWFAAGCPRAQMRPFGSFDEWAGVVGSVMDYAGIEGFLDNLDQTRSVQDEDNRQWAAVFDAWWGRFGDKVVTVAELFKAFFVEDAPYPVDLPDVLLIQKDRGDGSLRRSLGKQLSRLTGRIFDDRKLCDTGEHAHNKVRAWALRPVRDAETDTRNPANPALCGVCQNETPQRE